MSFFNDKFDPRLRLSKFIFQSQTIFLPGVCVERHFQVNNVYVIAKHGATLHPLKSNFISSRCQALTYHRITIRIILNVVESH